MPARIPASPAREKLREVIAARQDEEARLAALEEAQERAHREGWHAASRVQDAEGELLRVTRAEPQRKVYAFLNTEQDIDPVADAAAEVATARAEAARLEELEAALTGEISRVRSVLHQRRNDQYAALGELLAGSAAFADLAVSHSAAWVRLRTVRRALDIVVAGCHGQHPQCLADEARRAEPLEADRIGFPVNSEMVEAWARAMTELENNADAELPSLPAG
jgi:hypothetical protein